MEFERATRSQLKPSKDRAKDSASTLLRDLAYGRKRATTPMMAANVINPI